MLCEKCGKNNATTHIRSVVNGVISEKHLCGYCAADEGYSDIKSGNLSQMLSSMFGDTLNIPSAAKLTHCNCCGSTFSDIAKSGKCGCPECYATFFEQLLPYFKRVHGSTKHIGKIPNRTPIAEQHSEDTIDELRSMLRQLISEEEYEQAAVVRDKIKKIEGDML